MANNYEKQYMTIVENILNNGYYDNNRTGVPTYKLPHQIIQVNLQKEFPILKTKQVAFKTATKEMLWIWQSQSNDVTLLQNQNVHIWDEWVDSNNTIGKAYGYQIAKYKQLDKLIETLKNNPQDRRMIVSLWNIEDLPDMQLQPCCYQTIWDVTDGRLNCMLVQRSGDIPLGVPFNTTQYAVLVHMIAQITELKVGQLTHVINNAHIYENQIDGMKEQVKRYNILNTYNHIKDDLSLLKNKELMSVFVSNPKLKLNTNITNFYDFTIDDIKLEDYENMGKISMKVSV
ncbi:thymidylate synthase [Clostridium beijerinckii]|uniref:thymidylate synthase n=1 Tax=Clostridium beijerinckii TaxID=1520 RepID=UPI00156DA350|nr:thymidylate synthase [Clostridium beijerinckii]NRU52605.1 thymidylate synthase [Clostridium beijerinckii]NYC68648.1 thymidylate synthase [Clostridium beijerinckii]NYC91797.1 thymidylate synthase [Clostridium beijerinckii]